VTMDLPVAAPTEIGELRRSHSTLGPGQEPLTVVDRLLNAALCAGVGALLVLAIEKLLALVSYPHVLVYSIAALSGALVGFSLGRIEHFITYVGRTGIARFRLDERGEKVVDREMFLFHRAARMRSPDDVTTEWVDDAGGVLCRLREKGADAGWCTAARQAWEEWKTASRRLPDRALIVGGVELVVSYFPRQFLVVVNGRALVIPSLCVCCGGTGPLISMEVKGSSLREPLVFRICHACRWHVRLTMFVAILFLAALLFACFLRSVTGFLLVLALAVLSKRVLLNPGCAGLDWPVTARGRKDGFVSKDPKLRVELDEHWMAVGDEGVELKFSNAAYFREFLELNRGDPRDIRRLDGPPVS
jgi:hypothetical protein